MLELSGLTRRFGDLIALDGVSFSVAPGQMFGFVGPNGAGKTTAMRIVLGVLEADAGTVRWRGRAVDAAMRGRFGYMPEERGLYPKMRVRDQLVYFARLHGLALPRPSPRPTLDRAARARASAPATGWRRCRSATSSACSSASRSCTTRRCSCSTSRSPGSIPSASTS